MTAFSSFEAVTCIACAGTHLKNLGPLPIFTPDLFGRPREGQCTLGAMYVCQDCSLRFRWPMPTTDELQDYYRCQSTEERWQYEGERSVWKSLRRLLESSPERSVLDVGCFRGDLLENLGPGWARFGVEPSPIASQEARKRGVEILGTTAEDFEAPGRRFGAITLVDVMEHLPKPVECLEKLADMLLPGGNLVIFTGSTDAWSWRFAGLRYWYSALPEHVAFFSPYWFRWVAPRLGCELRSVERMAHRPSSWLARSDEALKNIAYTTYHRMGGVPVLGPTLQRLPGFSRVARWDGCWWTTARDHVLVALTRGVSPSL